MRPQRLQPTRFPRPWDSPGNNTGVGCHFLFQCMEVKSVSEAAQSCPTLSDPMDCSLPSFSHGIFQAGVLEWGAIAFSTNATHLCKHISSPRTSTAVACFCLPTTLDHGDYCPCSADKKTDIEWGRTGTNLKPNPMLLIWLCLNLQMGTCGLCWTIITFTYLCSCGQAWG